MKLTITHNYSTLAEVELDLPANTPELEAQAIAAMTVRQFITGIGALFVDAVTLARTPAEEPAPANEKADVPW